MRLIPILTALAVTAVLYLLVMERDTLSGFAGRGTAAPQATTETAAPSPEAPAPEQAARAVPVVTRLSVARTVENAVLLRGQTEAARAVEVRAETTGRVESEALPRGAAVAEGDVLCRLDPGTRQAALAEAEARLAETQLNLRNAEALKAGGFAAETRAVAARTALESARSAVEVARRELERLEIRAPFAGLLENASAEHGSLLQPGGLCAKVLQLDPMRLVGFVAEADVDRVRIGAMAGGRLATGREVAGQVSFVARSADPQTRTFRVEVTVANGALSIRDGQTVDIVIATEGTKAHLLAGSALTLDDTGRLGVRIVDAGGLAQFAPVRMLRDTPQGVLLGGLPDEVEVIVVGQEYVVDGVAVIATREEVAP